MGFFNKNKSSSAEEVNAKKKVKKKKFNETLASVVNESVTDYSVSQLFDNSKFVFNYQGKRVSAALLLDVETIGGLSKKTKKEDKGSIVVAISSGRLSTYISEECLANEQIIFIPDTVTLETMNEYMILTSAKYTWVLVDEDGGIENLDTIAEYHDAVDINEGKKEIQVVLGFKQESLSGVPYDSLANAEDVKEKSFSDVHNAIDSVSESKKGKMIPTNTVETNENAPNVSEYEPEPYDEYEPENIGIYQEPIQEEDAYMSYQDDYGDDYNAVMPSDELPQEYSEYEANPSMNDYAVEDELVSIEDTQKTVDEIIYNSDLGITVLSSDFDVKFNNKPFLLNENRGDSWLSEQVNAIAKDANAEINRYHEQHLSALRRTYIDSVTNKAASVTNEVIEEFEKKIGDLENEHINAIRNIEDFNHEDINRALREYELKKKAYVESISRIAETKYDNMNRAKHESEMRKLKQNVIARTSLEYATKKKSLLEQRREEAKQRYAEGVSEILSDYESAYDTFIEGENELVSQWQERISQYIDSYRKDEIARTDYLANKLNADNLVAEAIEKAKQEQQVIINRYEAEIEGYQRRIDEVNNINQAKLVELTSMNDTRIKELERRNSDVEAEKERLFTKYEKLSESKDKEYKSRIDALVAEKEGWESKFESAVHMSKKLNVTIGIAVLIALITCAAFGYIIGNTTASKPAAQPSNNPYVINVTPENK